MSIVSVNIPGRSYGIYIENGLFENLGHHVGSYYSGSRVSVITDTNVSGIYGATVESSLRAKGFMPIFYTVEPGEGSKSMETYQRLQESLADDGHQRTDLILALGGGVVGDLAGFVAATYLRGVPFIQVPTTLLSQIDSSVGGKTGINLESGKNLVGAIYQPKAVLIDPLTLDTLPEKYLRDGIGEAIKYGYIDRPELLDLLSGEGNASDSSTFDHVLENRSRVIEICCESKARFVLQDELDKGQRMILNFGHTLGHAIEKTHGYSKYTHGEAVAMGMYYMVKMTEHAGLSDPGLLADLENLLKRYQLLNFEMISQPEVWMEAVVKDKKNLGGKLNIIYVTRPGDPVIYPLQASEFEQMIKDGLS